MINDWHEVNPYMPFWTEVLIINPEESESECINAFDKLLNDDESVSEFIPWDADLFLSSFNRMLSNLSTFSEGHLTRPLKNHFKAFSNELHKVHNKKFVGMVIHKESTNNHYEFDNIGLIVDMKNEKILYTLSWRHS
jgi:hypothetical protein